MDGVGRVNAGKKYLVQISLIRSMKSNWQRGLSWRFNTFSKHLRWSDFRCIHLSGKIRGVLTCLVSLTRSFYFRRYRSTTNEVLQNITYCTAPQINSNVTPWAELKSQLKKCSWDYYSPRCSTVNVAVVVRTVCVAYTIALAWPLLIMGSPFGSAISTVSPGVLTW